MSGSLPLLDALPARSVSDTSVEAYAHILPTLKARQFAVLLALYDLLDRESYLGRGHDNATGAELTAFMMSRRQARDVNSVRPRLTELVKLGLVMKGESRRCRVHGSMAHPVWPVFPLAAVERAHRKVNER